MTQSELIKPKALKPGDTIGIFSPAYYLSSSELKEAKSRLEKMGFNVYLHPQTEDRDESVAGDPQTRLAAMHDLFADPKIDAIMCSVGGYGCLEFLDEIDFDLIRKNPKIIVGYSDNTVLLTAIKKRCGLVTFHGLNAFGLAQENRDAFSIKAFYDVVTGAKIKYYFPYEDIEPQVITPGVVEAVLDGGNHVLLSGMVGTPSMTESFNGTLFFTESNQPVYSDVDKSLFQFKRSGLANDIKGLILGRMDAGHYHADNLNYIRQNLSFEKIVKRHYPDVPSVIGFPCGHVSHLMTFPLGIKHRLTLGADNSILFEQLESACL